MGSWAVCICLFYRLVLLISFSDLLILGHNTHMLRLIKSEAEIKLLRQSASLTAKAFKKVRKMPRHRNPVLCFFCARVGRGDVVVGGREWEHTRRTKPLSKGGKETWISTFMPAYYSEGLSASLQIFCWLCVKIRSYYLPTQLNLAEARRLLERRSMG